MLLSDLSVLVSPEIERYRSLLVNFRRAFALVCFNWEMAFSHHSQRAIVLSFGWMDGSLNVISLRVIEFLKTNGSSIAFRFSTKKIFKFKRKN